MRKIVLSVVAICFVFQAQGAEKLRNGAPYFAEKDSSLPRNLLLFLFQGGPAALRPEQQGNILLVKEVLKEGPATQSLSEFKQQLFELGSEVEFVAEPNVFEIIVKSPPEEQAKVLALLKLTLENPRLSQDDFQRIHSKVLAGLRAIFEDMREVLFYFGPRDVMRYAPQTRTGETSPESFAKISYEDFKAALPEILNYQRMFVSYVGPGAASATKSQVEAIFQDKLQRPYQRWTVDKPLAPKFEKSQYTIINKPGATDNQIAFLFPQAVGRDSSEWAVSKINMDVLGGGLHGKLGQRLRAERGLTYAAMSWFSSTALPLWMVWTFGGIEQTKPLLTGVPEVLEQFVTTKFSSKELSESKARVVNKHKTQTELPKDRLQQKGWFYANGLSPTYPDRFLADVTKVTLVTANQFRASLQSKTSSIYVMGDKAKIMPMLEANGVPKEGVRIIEISEIK